MTQMTTAVPQCRTWAEFIAFCKAENVAFLNENRKRVYIEYVRNPAPSNGRVPDDSPQGRGKPTAVLVAFKNEHDHVSLGWSAAHPAVLNEFGWVIRPADEFNKTIGLWKAIRRATGQGRRTSSLPDRLLYTSTISFFERAVKELEK